MNTARSINPVVKKTSQSINDTHKKELRFIYSWLQKKVTSNILRMRFCVRLFKQKKAGAEKIY